MSVKVCDGDSVDLSDDDQEYTKAFKDNGMSDGYVDSETHSSDLVDTSLGGSENAHTIQNSILYRKSLESAAEILDLRNCSPELDAACKPILLDSFSFDSDMCDINNSFLENDSGNSSLTSQKDNIPKNLFSDSTCTNEISDSLDSVNSTLGEHEMCKYLPSGIENVNGDEMILDVPNSIDKKVVIDDDCISSEHTPYEKKKLKKILQALESNDVDFLTSAAISPGGLLNDDIRKKVWPKLVGVDLVETSPRPSQKEIEAHPYYQQVVLDVNRSLKRFPPSIKEAQRQSMLDQLVFLIMRVLCRHPEFHYYQGYHDICITFLLVLGEETAYHVIEKLSRTHLSVFMELTMEPTIHLLEYMYVLIGKKNSLLKTFLLKSEVGVAYCLSWLITWFGHVLNDYNNVVRLFDFFIVSHPWMPMYLTSAVVLHQELEVLKRECDMASVHSLLSNIPDDLPFEELIVQSLELQLSYDPKMLAHEHPYVKGSKLKTRKGLVLLQSISRTIKSAVPASNITLPIVVATAVLVTAVLYQAYKY